MNRPPTLEERLLDYGREFAYPPTPALHLSLRGRLGSYRVARVRRNLRLAAAALVLLAAALSVPRVRAQVLEIIQIGIVRIFSGQVAPAIPTGTSASTPGTRVPVTSSPRPTFNPQDQPEYIVSMQGIAGETTLEEAQKRLSFPILLPASLGEPDKVFLQQTFQMVVLVWMDENDPQKVRLSLHEIAPGSLTIEKFEPRLLQETQVNGQKASWVSGPYLVKLTDGNVSWRRIVDGNTLIWEADGITYRLESGLSLAETLPIAESVK